MSGKSEENIENYIFHALSGKSEDILLSLTAKSPIKLTWTHYRIILQDSSKEARDWYEQEAHYSVLNGSDQLFAAKYLTYMPKREDLRREIEQQKEFFRLQHKND